MFDFRDYKDPAAPRDYRNRHPHRCPISGDCSAPYNCPDGCKDEAILILLSPDENNSSGKLDLYRIDMPCCYTEKSSDSINFLREVINHYLVTVRAHRDGFDLDATWQEAVEKIPSGIYERQGIEITKMRPDDKCIIPANQQVVHFKEFESK